MTTIRGAAAILCSTIIAASIASAVPAIADDGGVDYCPGSSDSYGIADVDATTGNTNFNCAYPVSSTEISVKPNDSYTWSASAATGFQFEVDARWVSSSSLHWTATPGVNTYVATVSNSVAYTRHAAVNILWRGSTKHEIESAYYVMSATSGASAYLNPKWTHDQLVAARNAQATIYADSAYIAAYGTNQWAKNASAFCQGVLTKTVAPGDPNSVAACQTLAASPQKKALPLEPQTVTTGNRSLSTVQAVMPARLSLTCPSGSVPLFAEGLVLSGRDDLPALSFKETGSGVSVKADPRLDGTNVGLQLHCQQRSAKKVATEGAITFGTPRGDSVTLAKTGTAMLGLGDDRASSGAKGSVLLGGLGDDTLTVTGKRGVARGGEGDDTITGTGTTQVLIGGPGSDRIATGTGAVAVNAKDGKGGDTVVCGSAETSVLADAGDTLVGPCSKA